MTIEATTIDEYISKCPQDRWLPLEKLRDTILRNIPIGFEETMQYKMPNYVVPHKLHPSGYHCDTKLPLPFLAFASQKNFIAVYHMGIYADKELMDWFISEYTQHSKTKLDMGKSCLRFKNINDIPYELIGQLVSKVSVDDWINIYENNLLKSK